MRLHVWTLTLIILILSLAQYSSCGFQDVIRDSFNQMRNFFFGFIGRTSSNAGIARAARSNRLQPRMPDHMPFPCDTTNSRSPTPPETVHELRPGDIDVVAGMGDSLTAGNGAAATTLFQVSIENRGMSFAIGGQGNWRQYLTIPNILKEFNPKLFGYSLDDSLSHHKEAQFNVAEIGSMGEDLPYMARVLVKRIKADRRVNVEKHWKLINIMIGPNDFCLKLCYLNEKDFANSAEAHRKELMLALDYIRDNLPRTLVNLILPPNLEILHDLKGLPRICDELHILLCPCLFGILRQEKYPQNIEKQREWQRVQTEVADDERYKWKPDFAVVLQPFSRHGVFPEVKTPHGNITDRSYLSEDCFHFSQKANARAANALWNNMMEPVGSKSEDWPDIFSRFLCPTKERPYIATYKNSLNNQIIR